MVEKGYARVSDIAEHLGVHPSSVTKMVQKLDREDYLIYEKYRGLMLTKKGQKIGKRLVERHAMLESFLRLIGVDEAHVYEDVEGIEHHLSSNTLDCMTQFVEFFEDKPELMAQFRAFQELNQTDNE
jgi:Mn-dependent DtxR family transcriptional regulator